MFRFGAVQSLHSPKGKAQKTDNCYFSHVNLTILKRMSYFQGRDIFPLHFFDAVLCAFLSLNILQEELF